MRTHPALLFVIFSVVGIGSAFICGLNDFDPTVSAWIIMILIVVIIGAIELKLSKNASEGAKSVTYDKEKQTLHLHERNVTSQKHIKIKEYKHYGLKHNPAQLVYTSATVGGVTTGGFHVEKDYYSASSATATGRYELLYDAKKYPVEYCPIKKIVCDFEIKNNGFIEKFKSSKKELTPEYKAKTDTIDKEALATATRTQNTVAMVALTKDAVISTKLNLTDATRISNWVGGKE